MADEDLTESFPASTESPVEYTHQTVKVIRGREGAKIAQMQTEGWELVSQHQGTLRTELMFRRVRPQTFLFHLQRAVTQVFAEFRRLTPKTQRWVVGTVIGLLILIALISGLSAGNDSTRDASATASQHTSASAHATSPNPTPSPSFTGTSTVGSTPTPTVAPAVDISVDDLLDKLNSGGSKAGDVFRVNGELFHSNLWTIGKAGYAVYLKAKGGKDDLMVLVDEDQAKTWTDGTQVEMVLKNESRTIDGDTTDGWMTLQSAKVLSGATTTQAKQAAAKSKLLKDLSDYAASINSLASVKLIDSIGPSAGGAIYVQLNPNVASGTVFEAQALIKQWNQNIVEMIEASHSGQYESVKFYLVGDLVAQNHAILDPRSVDFKGMLDN